jgi:hypothetical protein
MTMTTSVVILDPAPIDQVWAEVQAIIGAGSDAMAEDRPCSWGAGERRRGNLPDQGFDALAWMYYGVDSLIEPDDDDGTTPVHAIRLGFDTPYSSPNCGHIQAKAVLHMHQWCTDRKLRMMWNDEHSGEWFDTVDLVSEKLGDPVLAHERP